MFESPIPAVDVPPACFAMQHVLWDHFLPTTDTNKIPPRVTECRGGGASVVPVQGLMINQLKIEMNILL